MWLKAVRSCTWARITHSAAPWLGLQGRPNWAYLVKLRKVPRKAEDYLVAMGVASLEILEPQTRLIVGRQRSESRRPDVMIGLKDWERMRALRQEQLAKWHIHMILRNGQKTSLNLLQDSQQAWRSKMEDYLVAMGVSSLEILEPKTRLRMGRQSRAGRT